MSAKTKLFDYFSQVCSIPRESGNEDGIRNFIVSWAEKNNFDVCTDKAGNVIVRKPATPGYENVPSTALQGHMDMVCVKTPESTHDFRTDPIELVEKDGFLYAKDTSLGADNGIAIAMVMALFSDPEAKHGPLEAVFTFSEETGMNGAFALDKALVKSRRMINLDSEEEGIIYVGCAGGADILATLNTQTDEVPASWEVLSVSVGGLKGGHSGSEIHRQRANAIKVLSRMLCSLEEENITYMLSSLCGGERHNVIPSSARCIICLPPELCRQAILAMQNCFEKIRKEYIVEDPTLFSIFSFPQTRPESALCYCTSMQIINALYCLPHGVSSFSKVFPGVVQTSDNLAIVNVENGQASVRLSIRSISGFENKSLFMKIKKILERFEFSVQVENPYPSWEGSPESALCSLCKQAWKDFTGKEPVITAIHAGLECGIINNRIPDMDSLSIGPDLFDVHSVNEHLNIASAERLYSFLKYMFSSEKV